MALSKRHHNSNSSSDPPQAPVIQSPGVFKMSANRRPLPETMMKQNQNQKPEAMVGMPSMFQEEREDDENMMNDLPRGTPADPKKIYVKQRSVDEEQPTQVKNHYFEDAFATRPPQNSPRAHVGQESIVVIEVKTNHKVRNDEVQLLANMTTRLANIYHRPESSMLVTLEQNAGLQFGDGPQPAYLVKVTALPNQIAPVTNLRNTVLIQSVLLEILRIPADRGVIVYLPIPEDNFATNGATTMREMARLQHQSQTEEPGILKSISRSMSRRFKSSSTHSQPMSVATSSSWNNGSDAQDTEGVSEKIISEKALSGSESDEKPRTVKKSRSLRQFVGRRLSELGSLGDVQ